MNPLEVLREAKATTARLAEALDIVIEELELERDELADSGRTGETEDGGT